MLTCKRLDLHTLGSQPVMPTNLPITMIRENRQLITDESVEVQDWKKITDRFGGIYRIYPNLIWETPRLSTYDRLDMQTLGCWLIMSKTLHDH